MLTLIHRVSALLQTHPLLSSVTSPLRALVHGDSIPSSQARPLTGLIQDRCYRVWPLTATVGHCAEWLERVTL